MGFTLLTVKKYGEPSITNVKIVNARLSTWSANCAGVASPLPEALPDTVFDADSRTLASCRAFCGQPS